MEFEEIHKEIIQIKRTSQINKENEKKTICLLISDTIFSKITSARKMIGELAKPLA